MYIVTNSDNWDTTVRCQTCFVKSTKAIIVKSSKGYDNAYFFFFLVAYSSTKVNLHKSYAGAATAPRDPHRQPHIKWDFLSESVLNEIK